jgi:DNA-binding NarL/FixJ family response regulator
VAEPFDLMLRERWAEAAQAWREIGCPYWEARALGASPDLDDARRAMTLLDELGAGAVREAVLRDRHAAGLQVPRGPRAISRGNPSQLTARELEVLVLLTQGLSNTQIAEQLFLSSKTVGHHVSSVLRKVGEPTRARAVATALRQGIVDPT